MNDASDSAVASHTNVGPPRGRTAVPLGRGGVRPSGHAPRAARTARWIGRHSGDVQPRVDEERRAPADRVEQELRQRPEHGAREAAEQRERSHRAAIGRAGDLVQRRERGIVQRGRHRDAGEQPTRASTVSGPCAKASTRARRRAEQRAGGRARAGRRARRCRDRRAETAMPDRKRPAVKLPKSHRSPTPVSARIGVAEHGDGVEQRAPRDDLRDAQRAHAAPQNGTRCADGADSISPRRVRAPRAGRPARAPRLRSPGGDRRA